MVSRICPHALAGWFTSEQDPHKILLLSYTAGRWDLLVIPPQTGALSAARLMAAASADTGPPTTATALVAAEQAGETSSSCEATTGRPGRLMVGM